MITNRNLLKPYRIVRVDLPSTGCEQGRRSYFGELMSFPIPSSDARPRITTFGHVQAIDVKEYTSTIMVRRVPGHPGTLDEIPVEFLHALTKGEQPTYVHYAVVSNNYVRHNSFPEDMLRYEQAVPVNFKIIEERPMYEGCDPEDSRLIIATADRFHRCNWSPRWDSFGWRVQHLRDERIEGGVA